MKQLQAPVVSAAGQPSPAGQRGSGSVFISEGAAASLGGVSAPRAKCLRIGSGHLRGTRPLGSSQPLRRTPGRKNESSP